MITQEAHGTVTGGVLAPAVLSRTRVDQAADTRHSVWQLLDDRLHGRWKAALLCGVALGLLLAAGGYLKAPVRYTSRGSIHVAPAGSPILKETYDTETIPRYDSRMTTQALLVKIPRVIDRALRDPDVLELPIARDPSAQQIVGRALSALPERHSELITVAYEDKSPDVAQRMLRAIMDAYHDIWGQQGSEFRMGRIRTLRDEQTRLRAEREATWRALQDYIKSSSYGVTDLQPVLQARAARMDDLQSELDRLELALEPQAGDEMSTGNRQPTDEELELLSPELAEVRRRYVSQVVALRQAREKYGERHVVYRELREEVELLEQQIAEYEQDARQRWTSRRDYGMSVGLAGGEGATKDVILERIERNSAELRRLAEEQAQIEEKKKELADTEAQLDEIERTLDVLKIEANALFSGSISIVQEASRPTVPSTDRRKVMAGLGLCAGMGSSVALFFIIGALDRRAFGVGQLRREGAKYRFLGLLPDLRRSGAGKTQCEIAAQCIHQIRNRIEALRATSSSFVLAVTSPYENDGKTSLALALGWSYAAAGYRVVIIDCDLIGRGVSHQMGVGDHEGLTNVLRSRVLEQEIAARPAFGFDVLGAGTEPTMGPENLRRDDFEALCMELRRLYDVIITDTGPFVGSVEMLPVIACSDAAIFSMRRGHSRGRLEECIAELDSIGVTTLGVVFNCAVRSDCNHYLSESMSCGWHALGSGHGASPDDEEARGRLDNAVVSAMELVSQS